MNQPLIIQGGMGVAVSGWTLARAVSLKGQLGVVSSTAIEAVMARRLQLGDVGGHMKRAFDSFPFPQIAEKVWARYFIKDGKEEEAAFKSKPIHSLQAPAFLTEMTVLANFCEVFLAKEGHGGQVGINLLEKIQLPTLPSLFGAMLAGVDFVIMGAGIPRTIPAVLDGLAAGMAVEQEIHVSEAGDGPRLPAKALFDPSEWGSPELKRPKFLAVISSNLLATMLAKKVSPPPDGFVIEGSTAGGHNAPPRGSTERSEKGEPIYTERDIPDLAKIRDLGLPFWLAGSYAGRLQEALALGAAGIQVGTLFAFCEESGMAPEIKARVLKSVKEGTAAVFTDPLASPTGFPFKVVEDQESLWNTQIYHERPRICDLGYLREAYRKEDGSVGFRCPAEPVEDYVAKGGSEAAAQGRACLCNGLMAAVGLGQQRSWGAEPPIITAGDELVHLGQLIPEGKDTYTASDVVDRLLA